MTAYIRELGPEMAENGYLVCPIKPGEKRPMGAAWGDNPLSAEACREYRPAEAGVGVILGKGEHPVYALDFDVEGDGECAAELVPAVAGVLGVPADAMVYRVGQPPKFLVPVSGEAGLRKRATAFFAKAGLRARFEFLGMGQQFVAEAVHPGTGAPYLWYGDPVLGGEHLPPACLLPRVDADKLHRLAEIFESAMSRHGWVRQEASPAPSPASPGDAEDEELGRLLVTQRPIGMTLQQAERYLSAVDDLVDDFDRWLEVGMALHHEFGGSPEALVLWNKWSAKGAKYIGMEDLSHRWAGFGRRGGPMKTMRWIVQEYRKKNPRGQAEEFTEVGRAWRMLEEYGDVLRYAQDTDAWYRWDGVHWRRQCESDMLAIAARVLGPLLWDDITAKMKGADNDKDVSKAYRFYFECQKSQRQTGLLKAAKSVPGFWCKESQFDANPRYFGVANGDIDLETGELLPPDPARMVSLASPIAYDPKAECPLWRQTLREIFEDDDTLIEHLQRSLGYAMRGNPVEEKAFSMVGSGANGKSLITGVTFDVFGAYAHSMPVETVTNAGGAASLAAGAARADLVALRGKRFVLVPETEERARLKEAQFKRLVSTDVISARALYSNEMISFRPQFVAFMPTNYLPRIEGTDDGVWRRMVIIPFNVCFTGRMDPERKAKLRKEYQGILRWFVEGALKYKESGLMIPEKVQAETRAYRTNMDTLQEWLDERCRLGAGLMLPVSEAWTSWQTFAERNGAGHSIPTKMALTQRLFRKGVLSKVSRVSGKTVRVYDGLALAGAEDLTEVK